MAEEWRAREEEDPEEGPSRRVWVRRLRDVGSEGGVGLGQLLEGIRSALEEQSWLMRQMWATHTAMESELRLLRHSAEYVFDRVFWVPYEEWRGEQGSGQREGEECGAPEEAREGEEETRE